MQCKSYSHFFSKNIRILYIESAKTVYETTLNELTKLTTLWTTGPNVFENALATTVNKFVINELVKLTMLWTTGPCSGSSQISRYEGYPDNIFLISAQKHMLWVLIRSASLRHFWWVPTKCVLAQKSENICPFALKKMPYLELWASLHNILLLFMFLDLWYWISK